MAIESATTTTRKKRGKVSKRHRRLDAIAHAIETFCGHDVSMQTEIIKSIRDEMPLVRQARIGLMEEKQ